MDGILIIDKPLGFTSYDVIRYLKKLIGKEKIGHTGTLDPLATGVLPLCLGSLTKLAGKLMEGEKEYEVKLLLGLVTDSLDLSGQVLKRQAVSSLPQKKIEEALLSFVGEIYQTPPLFSAVHIGGARLYQLARQGIKVKPRPRLVKIKNIELQKIALPYVWFKVTCSKGTYVRALCRDIGEKLGCGGCQAELKRTRCGPFEIKDAYKLENFHTKEDIIKNLISLSELLSQK
jgi:tRNA pseudouridine55 synthase